MVINDDRPPGADAHRREPDVVSRKAAGLHRLQGVLEAAEMRVDVVGPEGELDAAGLGPLDDVEAGDAVPRVDFQGDMVLFQDIQDTVHALRRPEPVIVPLQGIGKERRIGVDVRRLIGQDQHGLVNQVVHVRLGADAVEEDLLGAVDAGKAPLMVDDGHCVCEEIFKDAEGLLRECGGPSASLALHPEQEGLAADLIVVGIYLGIVGEHPAHAALAGVGCHSVVDAVVHAHRMGHLLGEVALEVDVVVDDREVALLQADDPVPLLVHGRQGVGRIHRARRKLRERHITELHPATEALHEYAARGDQLAGVILGAPGLRRLRVADDVHAVHLHANVLPANRHAEPEPLAVGGKGTVEVPDVHEAPCLQGAVDCPVMEQHAVPFVAIRLAETYDRLGAFGGPGLAREFEIGEILPGGPSLPF